MDKSVQKRISLVLKCKPEEVPEDVDELKKALDKVKEAEHGGKS